MQFNFVICAFTKIVVFCIDFVIYETFREHKTLCLILNHSNSPYWFCQLIENLHSDCARKYDRKYELLQSTRWHLQSSSKKVISLRWTLRKGGKRKINFRLFFIYFMYSALFSIPIYFQGADTKIMFLWVKSIF